MLKLEDLTIRQGEFTLKADFNVEPGRTVAVIGPSGAGKSTLIGAIAGFVVPDRGRVYWQGQDMTTLPPGQRPVAMLFQDGNLFPHLSIARNVGLGLDPRLKLNTAQ